jgi:hypothetical protein
MFGYIRPLRPELKVKDFDRFKACYCSLCHTLGKEYGLPARFILNYDFTFMAMLLWGEDEPETCCKKRCPVSPVHKKPMCFGSEGLSVSAGYSVILTRWKLMDSVRDDPFFKALGSRIVMLLLGRAYRKARTKYPEFDRCVRERLTELDELEQENCSSLDRTADRFAALLSAASQNAGGEKERIYEQIFYHMGRWIYIVDAVNDMEEDAKRGNFNAVLARYGGKTELGDVETRELKVTLTHSLNLIISAYGLLPKTNWTDVVENMLYLGMPQVAEAVFKGEFKNVKDGVPR